MTAPPDLFPYREVTENSCHNGHVMVRWSHLDNDECPVCRAMSRALPGPDCDPRTGAVCFYPPTDWATPSIDRPIIEVLVRVQGPPATDPVPPKEPSR